MAKYDVAAIIRALNNAAVRYLLVGGLAVVAHGYVRFTADVDIVLDLEEGNVRNAVSALKAMGYRPRAPVPFEQFADANIRAQWISEKKLTVFSLFSDQHPATEVDLFVAAPFDFDAAFANVVWSDIEPGVKGSFVGLPDLLALKQRAGRPQDLMDVAQLQALHKSTGNG